MTAIVPMLASAVVVWALQLYPLHRQRLAALRQKAAALRRG